MILDNSFIKIYKEWRLINDQVWLYNYWDGRRRVSWSGVVVTMFSSGQCQVWSRLHSTVPWQVSASDSWSTRGVCLQAQLQSDFSGRDLVTDLKHSQDQDVLQTTLEHYLITINLSFNLVTTKPKIWRLLALTSPQTLWGWVSTRGSTRLWCWVRLMGTE